MASSARKVVTLHLYKQLLRESQKFNNYNYRLYALRKIKDAFRSAKHETDVVKLDSAQKFAEESLRSIQRQVIISQFYKAPPLVVEKSPQQQQQ
ncbi:hypothetical protein HELRODRAFT_75876 [Helobdella robusta]|uniref:Complex 1 LYR protein domain-containing protein n=1 Tax=Helobdella robusta TaxID=6412 RepID=T1G2B9_HELRO|nr:hypothetical protein HELRODRAFT_75876 [Helobdella robusta]ESO07783.1 hypothetical protein HELRODRAFT_75876 [Helobdella robusta]